MGRADSTGSGVRVYQADDADAVLRFAAGELASGLAAMLGAAVGVEAIYGLDPHCVVVAPEGAPRERGAPSGAQAGPGAAPAMPGRAGVVTGPGPNALRAAARSSSGSATRICAALPDDGFAVRHVPAAGAVGAGRGHALVLSGGSSRAALHATYDLLERLGARFALGQAPELPAIEAGRLDAIAPYLVAPAFARRAFASDIMTWHYDDPARLRIHLEHDREFVSSMARRGINAFSYISHPQDTRLRVDELAPMLSERGIAAEYGGHVLPRLLPRERFAIEPECFPIGEDGQRNARGNLCLSNPAALELVRAGAMRWLRENAEIAMLHVWGADVRRGAWCRCARCAALSPQLQYMKVVNEIAAALEREYGDDAPPVAYLAYHDTLKPDPALRPHPSVWFEWAPRGRCYAHAIDDPACDVNPRYQDSLRRYIDLFEGRGGVFEYYADAILFGGMGFATPAVVVRDLRAYHRMGLRSISCLTFGAFSVLAYPVNLETFARATRSLDIDDEAMPDEIAALSHPRCAGGMGRAYRSVARASAMALRYGDVLAPPGDPAGAPARRARLLSAAAAMREAVAAAEAAAGGALSGEPGAARSAEVGAERNLWKYSAEALDGLAQWLEARTLDGVERGATGARAIEKIDGAIRHVRDIDLRLKGTWGAYDFERLREVWLARLKRRLEE